MCVRIHVECDRVFFIHYRVAFSLMKGVHARNTPRLQPCDIVIHFLSSRVDVDDGDDVYYEERL